MWTAHKVCHAPPIFSSSVPSSSIVNSIMEDDMTTRNGFVPLFALGQVLATPGAIEALK